MIKQNEIERLFRSNYKPMLNVANRFLHDEDLAHDIVHDVFAALLNADVSTVTSSYLLNAVRYACLKHIRGLSVRERFNNLYSLEYSDESNEDTWPDENEITLINNIVDRHLPEQTRKIVRMKFNGQLTYKEIADELSVSEVTVYKHLRKAIIIIRNQLEKNER